MTALGTSSDADGLESLPNEEQLPNEDNNEPSVKVEAKDDSHQKDKILASTIKSPSFSKAQPENKYECFPFLMGFHNHIQKVWPKPVGAIVDPTGDSDDGDGYDDTNESHGSGGNYCNERTNTIAESDKVILRRVFQVGNSSPTLSFPLSFATAASTVTSSSSASIANKKDENDDHDDDDHQYQELIAPLISNQTRERQENRVGSSRLTVSRERPDPEGTVLNCARRSSSNVMRWIRESKEYQQQQHQLADLQEQLLVAQRQPEQPVQPPRDLSSQGSIERALSPCGYDDREQETLTSLLNRLHQDHQQMLSQQQTLLQRMDQFEAEIHRLPQHGEHDQEDPNKEKILREALEVKNSELHRQQEERDALAQQLSDLEQAKKKRAANVTAEVKSCFRSGLVVDESDQEQSESEGEHDETEVEAEDPVQLLQEVVESTQWQVSALKQVFENQQQEAQARLDWTVRELHRQMEQLQVSLLEQQEQQLKDMQERGRLETAMMRQVMSDRVKEYEQELQQQKTQIQLLQRQQQRCQPQAPPVQSPTKPTFYSPTYLPQSNNKVQAEQVINEDCRRTPFQSLSNHHSLIANVRAVKSEHGSYELDQRSHGTQRPPPALSSKRSLAPTLALPGPARLIPSQSFEDRAERRNQLRRRRQTVESFMRAQVELIRKQNLDSPSSSLSVATTAAESASSHVSIPILFSS
ncbi:hypothetical protein ACA910_002673 [Epithemia clementina (nom. ined.)]